MIVSRASEAEQKDINLFMDLFNQFPVPAQPQPTQSAKPEPTQGPTKALGILADSMNIPDLQDLYEWNKINWNFFATDYGQTVGCRWDPVRWDALVVDRTKRDVLWYPGGEYPLELFGKQCTYENSGDNVGKLFCGDQAIECFWDPANQYNPESNVAIENGNYSCRENWTHQPVFTCPF